MEHFGDITQINGYEVPIVDIVTGGSPCQDLSIAGGRAGLEGERSGLFMEQIRLIKEIRENDKRTNSRSVFDVRPRYMVWENVPGAFSSNKGEDFRCVLEETAKISEKDASIPRPEGGKWNKAGCIVGNGWSIAWRLHDAQFWGVPQRRKRICLLADFNGDSAPKILFELFGEANESNENETELGFREESESKIQSLCDSLSRDIEQSEQKRKKTSSVVGECTNPTIVLENHPNDSRVKICEDNIFQTLSSRMGTGGGNVPMVMEQNCVYSIGNGQVHDAMSPSKEVSKTLNCLDDPAKILTYGLDRAAFNQGKNAQFDFSVEEDLIGSQVARGPGAVASFYPQRKAESQCFRQDDVSVTLVNGTNPGFQNGIIDSVVRRLTPLECERLQGFPDGWTDIGEWIDSKGKKHREADSPRYKALGNSIALPFWRWLAERIVTQYDRQTTMASLFDGIGGFPLVFSDFGCEPLWASEIEEFPIAVTKMRFK